MQSAIRIEWLFSLCCAIPMNQIRLGLKENWRQFSILVIINAFVGGMVGLERSILPEIGVTEFEIAAKTAILSFIVVFGIVKAVTNYYTGALANKLGRRKLLIIGWMIGLPVPLILMFANHWNWVILANVLLGINQGLTWSSTVVMKIDLVGEKQRGLAMGINESAGYLAVGLLAFFTGWIAHEYGLRPYPFYLGLGLAIMGLLGSVFLVRDTRKHVNLETKSSSISRLQNVFLETSIKHRNLGSVTQAGLVNNLNDGMMWGIFPILLASKGFGIMEIGTIAAVYPTVWGICQLFTGAMADFFSKKKLLVLGMLLQGAALFLLVMADSKSSLILISTVLGIGTALVYPTFLAAIAENTHPMDRANSIGVFRLWRDLGYAVGAILTGIIADLVNVEASINSIAGLTILSGLVILTRMK